MHPRSRSFVLLLVVLALLLASCGAATAPADTAANPSATDAPAASAPTSAAVIEAAPTSAPDKPASSEPVDIELWVGGAVSEAGPPPDDWAAYQIIRDELGVNLNLSLLPSGMSDADAKINAAAAANALPDLFQINRDAWYRLVEAGLVAPVDDLLPQMPERTKTHYSDEIRNKLVTIDGKMYGLPEPGALPHTDGLVIRQDWLDKLGLETPTTLEEFLAVAKAFTEQDPDGNGQNDTYGFGAFIDGAGLTAAGLGPRFDFIYGAYGVGGVWNLASDTVGLNVRDPRYMQATGFVKQLVDEQVIDPDWPTLKKDEFRARWKQGRYGIMIENFCALACVANYKDFDTNFPEGEWVVLAPPTGPDGDSATGVNIQSVRILGVSQQAIDAGKGPAIAKLLEWMANEEGYYLLGFGQAGVNYKRDANGFVTTEGIDEASAWTSKEQQPLTQLRNLVFINNEIELKARYVPFETSNGRTIDPLDFRNGFDEQPWTESTGAAVINPPTNAADFTRYYSENLVQFVLGQRPLDQQNWDEYLQGLDSLGAQELETSARETLTTSGFLE